MKINNFQGELSDISNKKEALVKWLSCSSTESQVVRSNIPLQNSSVLLQTVKFF